MAELPVEPRIVDLERRVQQLETALVSSRVIATAVGLVMAGYRLDRGEAFALLAEQSKHTNTRVSVLALDLVARAEQAAHRDRN